MQMQQQNKKSGFRKKNNNGKNNRDKRFDSRPPNHLTAHEWRDILEFDEGEPKVYPQFKKITTHRQPHADEILALMMVATPEGRKVFPNLFPDGKIDFDKIEFVDKNSLPKGRSYKQRPATLHIGCGEDPRFDEHGRDDSDYKSACSLMANAVGLRSDPHWIHVVECVRREDREGGARLGEIAFVLKKLYQATEGEDDIAVIQWAIIAFDAVVKQAEHEWNAVVGRTNERSKQLFAYAGELAKRRIATTKTVSSHLIAQNRESDLGRFKVLANLARHHEAEMKRKASESFLAQAKCYAVRSKWGPVFRLFAVESDNPEMATVCWREFNADILIIRSVDRNGQTAVFTNKPIGIRLGGVFREILRQEKNEDAEWVNPHDDEATLLNGSLAFTGVPPTGLSPHEIALIIQRTLGKNQKHEAKGHEQPRQVPIVSVGLAFSEFETEFAEFKG